jgi:hypothetical protein
MEERQWHEGLPTSAQPTVEATKTTPHREHALYATALTSRQPAELRESRVPATLDDTPRHHEGGW